MNVLFVCTANISRSYLSEKLFQYEVQERGLEGIAAASAGLEAFPGSPPDPKMAEFLVSRGISPEEHRSRRLDEESIRWADRILVMEKRHLDRIEALFPAAGYKTERIGKYVSGDGSEDDIADPYGRTSYHYRLAQAQIQMAVERLLETILLDRQGRLGGDFR